MLSNTLSPIYPPINVLCSDDACSLILYHLVNGLYYDHYLNIYNVIVGSMLLVLGSNF